MFSAEDPRAIINGMTFVGSFRSKFGDFITRAPQGAGSRAKWRENQNL